jgi:hypothetical protein
MPSTAPTMPLARQLRLAWRSRDRWKERAAQKQRLVRKLRVEVRDLRASRDRWRGEADSLRAALSEPPSAAAPGACPSGEP